MNRIDELQAMIEAAKNIINELGNSEWVSDQVRYQERRISIMERDIEDIKGGGK